MKNPVKSVLLPLALLSLGLSPLHSADIGDFSPMQVGNVWKYKGSTYQTGINYYRYSDSILRVVGVFSLRQAGDTSVYGILIGDSIFNRSSSTGLPPQTTYYPDLVSTKPDSQVEVQGVVIRSVFATYSRLIADTRIHSKVFIGGQDRWVFSDYDPYCPGCPNGSFVQDYGRFSYKESSSFPGGSYSKQYLLFEFNGVPLGNYTITGLLKKPVKGRGLAVFPTTEFGTIFGTYRDVLGRIPIGLKPR